MSKRPRHSEHTASEHATSEHAGSERHGSPLEGKSFNVYSDATTIKYKGRVVAEVSDGMYLVEVIVLDQPMEEPITQRLVPVASMRSGSLERGAGTWEFTDD